MNPLEANKQGRRGMIDQPTVEANAVLDMVDAEPTTGSTRREAERPLTNKRTTHARPNRLAAAPRGDVRLIDSSVDHRGFLGRRPRFDEAVAAFARAYADQTERDHAARVDVRSQRVFATAVA